MPAAFPSYVRKRRINSVTADPWSLPSVFVVDGIDVDVTDRRAVQALTLEQYVDLLRRALVTAPDADDVIVGLREVHRTGPILWDVSGEIR